MATFNSHTPKHLELIGTLQSLIALLTKLKLDSSRDNEFYEYINMFYETLDELEEHYIHKSHKAEAVRRLKKIEKAANHGHLNALAEEINEVVAEIEERND